MVKATLGNGFGRDPTLSALPRTLKRRSLGCRAAES